MKKSKAVILQKVNMSTMSLTGVDNLLVTIAFFVRLGNLVKEALADKKFSWGEGFSIGWFLFRNVKGVITAIPYVDDELKDKLTQQELAEILNALMELNYIKDIKVSRAMLKDTLEVVAKIKNYIFKWFIKDAKIKTTPGH